MNRVGSERSSTFACFLRVFLFSLLFTMIDPCSNSESTILAGELVGSTLDSISLDNSMSSWFPVDCHNDNRWDLAIALAGSPTRVGVFNVLSEQWISGPFELPVEGSHWGAGNYDTDATIEYAYLHDLSIRKFDPDDASDFALWQVPFAHTGALFFGESSQSSLVVALLKHISFDTTVPWPPFVWVRSYERWYLHRYEFLNGAFIDSGPAGPALWLSIYNTTSSSPISLTIGYHSTSVDDLFFYSESTSDSIKTVSNQWVQTGPSYGRSYGCGPCNSIPPHREQVRQTATGRATPSDVDFRITEVDTGASWPGLSPNLLGHSEGPGTSSWRISWPGVTQGSRYRAFAIADPDGDGINRCYLPIRDSSIWEVRDITTGEQTGRMYSMPDVDLYAGPLFTDGEPTLFYFLDSGVFFYSPGAATGIFDDPALDSNLYSDISITAAPNPFNSNTVLSWPDVITVSSLSIHNILGQTVKTFAESALSGNSTIAWDGLDGRGRPIASGVYFARLVTGDHVATAKLVLLR